MDNLDRTNVAQAAFAKYNLNRQLKAVGVMAEHDNIDNHEDMSFDFRFSQFMLEEIADGLN
jgi:phosphatidylinositol 4-phosphatase